MRGRDLLEQARDVLRLERLREALRELRRGQQVGGVGRDLAVLEQAAEEAAWTRACAPWSAARRPSGRGGRPSGAAPCSRPRGVEAVRGGPGGEFGGVGAVGLAGAFGGAAALQVGVEGAQRGAPAVLTAAAVPWDGRERVLHRYLDRSDRHAATGWSRPGVTPSDDPPPRPWHPVRGDRDASTLWYAVMRKQTQGRLHRHPLHSPLRAPCLPPAGGWQEVAPEDVDGGAAGVAAGPLTRLSWSAPRRCPARRGARGSRASARAARSDRRSGDRHLADPARRARACAFGVDAPAHRSCSVDLAAERERGLADRRSRSSPRSCRRAARAAVERGLPRVLRVSRISLAEALDDRLHVRRGTLLGLLVVRSSRVVGPDRCDLAVVSVRKSCRAGRARSVHSPPVLRRSSMMLCIRSPVLPDGRVVVALDAPAAGLGRVVSV